MAFSGLNGFQRTNHDLKFGDLSGFVPLNDVDPVYVNAVHLCLELQYCTISAVKNFRVFEGVVANGLSGSQQVGHCKHLALLRCMHNRTQHYCVIGQQFRQSFRRVIVFQHVHRSLYIGRVAHWFCSGLYLEAKRRSCILAVPAYTTEFCQNNSWGA